MHNCLMQWKPPDDFLPYDFIHFLKAVILIIYTTYVSYLSFYA